MHSSSLQTSTWSWSSRLDPCSQVRSTPMPRRRARRSSMHLIAAMQLSANRQAARQRAFPSEDRRGECTGLLAGKEWRCALRCRSCHWPHERPRPGSRCRGFLRLGGCPVTRGLPRHPVPACPRRRAPHPGQHVRARGRSRHKARRPLWRRDVVTKPECRRPAACRPVRHGHPPPEIRQQRRCRGRRLGHRGSLPACPRRQSRSGEADQRRGHERQRARERSSQQIPSTSRWQDRPGRRGRRARPNQAASAGHSQGRDRPA